MGISKDDFGLGCLLDDPRFDHTDKRFKVSAAPPLSPIVTRNRDRWLAPIKNQKRSNGCTGFSGSTAVAWAEFNATKVAPIPFSPLFGWSVTRGYEGMFDANVGCAIRDFAYVAKTYGICSEDRWPFELLQSDDYLQRLGKPPASAYEEAARHQTLDDFVIEDGDTGGMLDALSRGLGFQFGIPVYESFFDTPSSGIVDNTRGLLVGWHAIYCWDADVIDGKQYYWCDNSWSKSFGKDGRMALDESLMRKSKDIRVYTKVELT